MTKVKYTSIARNYEEHMWSFTNRMAEAEQYHLDHGERVIFRQLIKSESGVLVFVLGYEYEEEAPFNGEPSFKEANV